MVTLHIYCKLKYFNVFHWFLWLSRQYFSATWITPQWYKVVSHIRRHRALHVPTAIKNLASSSHIFANIIIILVNHRSVRREWIGYITCVFWDVFFSQFSYKIQNEFEETMSWVRFGSWEQIQYTKPTLAIEMYELTKVRWIFGASWYLQGIVTQNSSMKSSEKR